MSFEKDIKTLFRASDREEMDFMFDLWSYDDVKEAAHGILERVADGTMPCDEPWDDAKVSKFRAWVDAGCPE